MIFCHEMFYYSMIAKLLMPRKKTLLQHRTTLDYLFEQSFQLQSINLGINLKLMEGLQALTYIYIQPISTSLTSSKAQDGQLFSAENHLQIDGPKFFSSKNRRAPLKVRDILKINKEYKVYNRVIHYYNFLYQLQIKNDCFQQLATQSIKIRLVSKNYKGEAKVRNYLVSLRQLLKGYSGEGIEATTQTICQSGNGKDSDFMFNLVKSNSLLSLVSLEQLLQEKRSEVFSELWQKGQNSEEYNIVLKQSVNTEVLSTIASSEQWSGHLDKISRKSEISQRSSLKRLQRRKQDLFEGRNQQKSVREINQSPVRKQADEQCENTYFLDQSPKLKRLYRLRRSSVRPSSLHCEMDQVDTLEPFFKLKSQFTGYFHNVLIVVGMVLVYFLMSPSSRV